jgi:hypothetical protein
MKLCMKLLAIAVIAVSTYSLTGCSAPPTFSYQNVTIAISSFCSDCASSAYLNGGTTYNPAYPLPPNPGSVILMPNTSQGGTTTFVATVTNAPQNNVTWTIYPTPNLGDIDTNPSGTSTPVGESGNPMGTIQATSGNTITYTIPGAPVYSGAALLQANQLGIPEGDVLLVASVPINPGNPSVVATQSQLIQIFGGSSIQGPPGTYLTPATGTNPSSQTQPAVTVARNASYAFFGGQVGAGPCTNTAAYPCTTASGATLTTGVPDNSVYWGVCPATTSACTSTSAIIGGNTSLGTITQQGVYTAPAIIPTTALGTTSINNEVEVIVYSHLAPATKSYAYVGIN